MRIVANSIPKSGTHLLDRLLVLLGFEMVDLGGVRPHLAKSNYRFPLVNKRLKSILGLRGPEDVMGIGPHLVEGGRFRPARRLLRGRGEKVTVGVVSPQPIGRRWLTRRLSKVPDGGFVSAHCIYTPQLADLFRQQGMSTVCILRDPRDVAVSQMHYIKQLENHFAHEGYMALPSDKERLLLAIRGGELGGRRLQSLDERYRQFLRWERDGGAVVAKFEDLVGTRGGGSAEAQRLAVERVAEHLGVEVDEATMRAVEEGLFGAGRTFRKGQIGGWREEFSAEHARAVEEVLGPLLVELGYEAGPNW
ncbi:MAG: sulfotransferase domain-containing protein [Actinomycetota bacterium]|nr:sulfotransferase domain-containing protein [Actinomycetota bacterium]